VPYLTILFLDKNHSGVIQNQTSKVSKNDKEIRVQEEEENDPETFTADMSLHFCVGGVRQYAVDPALPGSRVDYVQGAGILAG